MAKKKIKGKPIKRNKKKAKETDWDAYEAQARKRSAWSEYVGTMHNIKMRNEEQEYQTAKTKRDTKKIQEIEEKRNGRSTLLYIG